MSQIEIVAVSNIYEEQEVRLTFDETKRIDEMVEEILDELGLDIDMCEIYHDGNILDVLDDQKIRDSTITAENNRIDIVMSKRYKSFLEDPESGVFGGDFYDYLVFYDGKHEIEKYSREIDNDELIGEYLKDSSIVFDLRFLILYSKFKTLCEEGYSDKAKQSLFRFINRDLADKSAEYDCEDDGVIAMNPEYLFHDNVKILDSESPKTSLEVLARLRELEKSEWETVYSDDRLIVWRGSGSAILVSFLSEASMAFLQHKDLYVFIARECHYTCLMHNGFYDTDENYFQNGFYLGDFGGDEKDVLEKMKGMCTSFYSENENPLFDALNSLDLDLARSILVENPNLIESLNEYGTPALLIATRIGWIDAVKVLLEFTDDPNKNYSERGSGSIKTLMSCARKNGNQELVSYLESIGVHDLINETGLNVIPLPRSDSGFDFDSDSS